MGGVGSGRDSKYLVTPYLDKLPYINAGDLLIHNTFEATEPVMWTLTCKAQAEVRWGAHVLDNEATIVYAIRARNQPVQVKSATVSLSWSSCNYGGRRPWFLCPGTSDMKCDRRVGKLYVFHGQLICRHCCALGYKSDHLTPRYRSLERAKDILRRLGGTGSFMDDFPTRPKGMHFDIYHSLYWQFECYLDDFASDGNGEILRKRKAIAKASK